MLSTSTESMEELTWATDVASIDMLKKVSFEERNRGPSRNVPLIK